MAKAATKTTPAKPKTAPKATTAKAAGEPPKVLNTPKQEGEAGPAHAIGDVIIFVGYSEPLGENMEPLYFPNDRLTVTGLKEDGGIQVVKEGTDIGDTVFPEEVRAETDEDVAEVVEETEEEVVAEEVVAEDETDETVEEGEEDVAEDADEGGEVATAEGEQTEGEMDEEAGNAALDSAKELAGVVEDSYFSLGAVLTDIYDNGYHRLAGHEIGAFEAYLDSDLGGVIGYKKAIDLITIHRLLAPLNVDKDRLREIGYTKARTIAQRFKDVPEKLEENYDAVIDMAVEKSRSDLDTGIRVTYLGETVTETSTTSTTTDTGESVRMTTFKFKLFEDQGKLVQDAVTSVREKSGLSDDSAAMHQIIVEWAQLSEGVEVPLADALKAIETRYNVTLTSKPVKAATAAAAAPKTTAAAAAPKAAATKPAAAAPKAATKPATTAKPTVKATADKAEATASRSRSRAA